MIRNIWTALSIALLLSAGCGAAPEAAPATLASELTVEAAADAVPASAMRILPPGAQHLYFDTPTAAYLSEDQPYGYGYFTARAGQEFKAGAYEDDGTGTGRPLAGQVVDFKLQRAVKKNGRWQWAVVGHGTRSPGAATLKYTPSASASESLYLITAVAQEHPATITLTLGCRGGTGCAIASQPGESCGGHTRTPSFCDDGLFCNYEPGVGSCGYADAPGSCAVRPTICTRNFAPVCGCDGNTYSNKCTANAAGVGVLHTGSCPIEVVGQWQQKLSSGAVVEYTFEADGTFYSVEQPACVFAKPACAVKLAPGRGTYSVLDSTVSLSYSSPSFHAPKAVRFVLATTKGASHLRGEDYGQKLDLTVP